VSDHVRPVLLGYLRVDVLRNGTEVPRMEAELQAFADAEEFGLGTVYVEQADAAAGAFHALMAELARDESVRGLVVPDLRHLTVHEQLVLSRHADGGRAAVFAACVPTRAGGPGVESPDRARPAVPAVGEDRPPQRPGLRT
jgi:hypothetical protein